MNRTRAMRRLMVLLVSINRQRIMSLPKSVRKDVFSGEEHYCVLCRSRLRDFLAFGITAPRPNAMCPVCGSLERHRAVWAFLQQRTNLFAPYPKKLLHIAPERALESKFSQVADIDYLTADLDSPRAMVKMDITDIQYPDDSFDAILCSHVLEHVPDDRRAMREFNRVLKPGGWAAIMVPITTETTFEDPAITSPEERERVFGQHNHVRRYGLDFKDRLEEAGFDVRAFRASELVAPEDFAYLGIGRTRGEEVFLCSKGSQGDPVESQPIEIQELHRQIGDLNGQLSEERRRFRNLQIQAENLNRQLKAIEDSTTWKLLRGIASVRSKVLGKAFRRK